MKKRITAGCAAFIAAALLLTGCNNNNNAEGQPSGTDTNNAVSAGSTTASEIAEEYFPKTRSDFPAWADIDPGRIIAQTADGTADKEFFDIPFSEFFSEYMYYLISYQITDDMSEENKEKCAGYRDNIISYMTFERMYLYIADKEYGISESTLTQEQLDEVRTNADNVKKDWAANFYAAVTEKLGEDASEEDKEQMCMDVLHIVLTKCGLDENIFYNWELSHYIQEKVIEKLAENAGDISEDDVTKMLDEFIEEAKDKAENSPADYESLTAYPMVYIPEGTRVANHIFISFSDEDLTKIAQAKSDGKEEETDKLVEAAYTEDIRAKVEEVSRKLAEGTDFAELQSEYNSASSEAMIVLKNSPSFFEEYRTALYSLENIGDVSEPVNYSNGIYFIQYAQDAEVTAEETEQIRESMRSYLKDYAAQSAQNAAYTEWLERFPYTIDYDLLQIDKDTAVLSGIKE